MKTNGSECLSNVMTSSPSQELSQPIREQDLEVSKISSKRQFEKQDIRSYGVLGKKTKVVDDKIRG